MSSSHPITQLFFGRRMGRPLTHDQSHILTEFLPKLTYERWINRWPLHTWMEIGFGYGDHLLSWLDTHPKQSIIGIEVFKNGVSHFVQKLHPSLHERCSIFYDPIQLLLPHIPDHSLEGIIIFFPDPWPKKKHHKRRLIQHDFLKHCARLLGDDGEIHFASDHPDLVNHVFKTLHESPDFSWKKGMQDPHTAPWPAWPLEVPPSRYCQKALKTGRPCAYTVWQKRQSAGQK